MLFSCRGDERTLQTVEWNTEWQPPDAEPAGRLVAREVDELEQAKRRPTTTHQHPTPPKDRNANATITPATNQRPLLPPPFLKCMQFIRMFVPLLRNRTSRLHRRPHTAHPHRRPGSRISRATPRDPRADLPVVSAVFVFSSRNEIFFMSHRMF